MNKIYKSNGLSILLVIIGFSTLYSLTLFHGIGGRVNFGDSAKWQYLWATGGTPHSTGYPLFLALTHLYGNTLTLLEPWLRISLISFTFGVATLASTWLLASEIIKSYWARWLVVLLVGTQPLFWSQATEPEVYTLNSFFVATVLWLALRYYATQNTRYFLAAGCVYALSFGNHLTMITLLPALFWLTVIAMPWRLLTKPRIMATILLAVALGASQYLFLLYLSYQDSPHLEFIGSRSTIEHWLIYITGGQFRDQIGNANLWQSLLRYSNSTSAFFGWPLAAIAAGTTLNMLANRRFWPKRLSTAVSFLIIAMIGQLAFSLQYDIIDIDVYYIPANLILAVLLGKAIDEINLPILLTLTCAVVFAALLQQGFYTYKTVKPTNNIRQDAIFQAFSGLPTGATILNIPTSAGNFLRGYDGQQVLNYAQYIKFEDKRIHILSTATTRLSSSDSAFILQAHLESPLIKRFDYEYWKPGLYVLRPKGANKTPYIFDFEDHQITFSSWFGPEANHRWTNGTSAEITLPETLSQAHLTRIHLGVSALGQQRVHLLLNGVVLGDRIIEGSSSPDISLDIDPAIWQMRSPPLLRFELPDARTPDNGDQRTLALALHYLALE